MNASLPLYKQAVYCALLYALLPVLLIRLAVRGLRNRDYWRRWPERFGFTAKGEPPTDVWVHAVSVGEARAAAPIVEHLLGRYPNMRVLVTTMTPTGSEQVRQLFGDRVAHCYVPYDFPDAVARFLKGWRPQRAIIMETEIWPNIVCACDRRGIPLVFANVRLSAKSFASYARVRWLIGPVLRLAGAFAVQGERDAERMRRLGAPPAAVTVTGSVKFEVKLPPSLNEVAAVLRREWGQRRPVWIAGSTHDPEETLVLEAFRVLRRRHPDLLLVIVPRHPERFTVVVRLCERAGHQILRRSESGLQLSPETEILIGDTMGELTLLYAASDVAFVGGSLAPIGGHNVLEPCALGIPAIYGPHMFNFQDISALVLEAEAGVMIESGAELADAVHALLSDPNRRFRMGESGKRLIEENRGALQRTVAVLEHVLGLPDHASPGT